MHSSASDPRLALLRLARVRLVRAESAPPDRVNDRVQYRVKNRVQPNQ